MKRVVFWRFFLMISFAVIQTLALCAQSADSIPKNRKKDRRELMDKQSKLMEEEGVHRYKKQWVSGFKLTSDGYGGFIEYGRYRSPRKSLLFQLDIAERKHLKEEKLDAYESSMQPFIYGKLNFFYPVKLGVQFQYLLGNKGNTNGVNVTLNTGGGVVLGLLRPYQYQLTEDSMYILGGPSISDGWSQMKMTPGVHIKTAVRFDYGKFKDIIAGIEIGAMGEYYFDKIPQMALISPRRDFSTIYMSLIMGRRK